MEQTVKLLELFPGFDPEETERPAWEQAVVRHAKIDRAARAVTVDLSSAVYLPVAELEHAERAIERVYGLHRIRLKTSYPEEMFEAWTFRT